MHKISHFYPNNEKLLHMQNERLLTSDYLLGVVGKYKISYTTLIYMRETLPKMSLYCGVASMFEINI